MVTYGHVVFDFQKNDVGSPLFEAFGVAAALRLPFKLGFAIRLW